jgi:hypothetical protein
VALRWDRSRQDNPGHDDQGNQQLQDVENDLSGHAQNMNKAQCFRLGQVRLSGIASVLSSLKIGRQPLPTLLIVPQTGLRAGH